MSRLTFPSALTFLESVGFSKSGVRGGGAIVVNGRTPVYGREECFDNMLAVWTPYGRPPKYSETWSVWRRAHQAAARQAHLKSKLQL